MVMSKKCVKCGVDLEDAAVFCDECGAKQPESVNAGREQQNNANVRVGVKKRTTAGLLGIFLGGLGVHNFYLGFNVKAIVQILLTVFCCGAGGIWGFIEGIMILTNKINADSTGATLQ